eukprot:SAG11_NODE_410_length_9703_cov_3.284777_10_plen_131_part_00
MVKQIRTRAVKVLGESDNHIDFERSALLPPCQPPSPAGVALTQGRRFFEGSAVLQSTIERSHFKSLAGGVLVDAMKGQPFEVMAKMTLGGDAVVRPVQLQVRSLAALALLGGAGRKTSAWPHRRRTSRTT